MKRSWKKSLKTLAGVLAGNAILAAAVAAFIVPNGIIMGGATGIGLAISHYLPVDLSLIIFCVNAVLFILGALILGKTFIVTTIISTFVYPAFLSAMQAIPGITRLTDNVMLATIYGGVLLGIGVGLIVRVGASTGGTDILALVLNRWVHVSVAVLLYIVDFLVLSLQAFFSDSEQILYGILALVLNTLILNRVMLMGKSPDPAVCHIGQVRRSQTPDAFGGRRRSHYGAHRDGIWAPSAEGRAVRDSRAKTVFSK